MVVNKILAAPTFADPEPHVQGAVAGVERENKIKYLKSSDF